MFFRDDVVYSKTKERIVFMEATVFTTVFGTCGDSWIMGIRYCLSILLLDLLERLRSRNGGVKCGGDKCFEFFFLVFCPISTGLECT
jgi:hypothetical protein